MGFFSDQKIWNKNTPIVAHNQQCTYMPNNATLTDNRRNVIEFETFSEHVLWIYLQKHFYFFFPFYFHFSCTVGECTGINTFKPIHVEFGRMFAVCTIIVINFTVFIFVVDVVRPYPSRLFIAFDNICYFFLCFFGFGKGTLDLCILYYILILLNFLLLCSVCMFSSFAFISADRNELLYFSCLLA